MCRALISIGVITGLAIGGTGSIVEASGITAAEVVQYVPGSAPEGFRNAEAAVGLPEGDTTYGALTPFNPPFDPGHIVVIGAGGVLDLRLSSAVAVTPEAMLGVFVNVGLVDISDGEFDDQGFPISGGTGLASDPPMTFSPAPRAMVSVSSNGTDWVPVSATPVTFDVPTNYYTDVEIDKYFAEPGNEPTDFWKAVAGDLSSFGGLSYLEMVELLDGSAGGNWLDLSGSGLESVEYVRFEVPAGADYRMVVDSVTAIPEPSVAGMVLGLGVLMRRRRRR
jgi:hypothetical protein